MKSKSIIWIAMAALLAACDSPLETDPTTSIPSDEALSTPRGIELAVNGVYRSLQDQEGDALYNQELTVFPDLYSDNLTFTGTFGTHGEVGNRNISASNGAILNAWEAMYEGINRANNVLAAIPRVEELGQARADEYRGEALFLRALHYFNLVRYFGGVPLVLEPSEGVSEEANLPRSSAEEVYALIEQDLQEVAALLPSDGNSSYATRGAALALLARAYLAQGEWTRARDLATQVIESGEYALLESYAELFENKNSSASILEVQYSVNNSNPQAFWYFPDDLGGRRGYAPTRELYDAYEPGDTRRDFSIGISDGDLYGSKYFRVATGDDNVFVIRLAEMYLIRAEANARLGADPATVRADINVIRSRAGLPDLPTTVDTGEELISAILRERRLEFAFEGHRFFDLRRTGRAQEVLGISQNQLLFPIPQAELDVNDQLTQNPGY